MMDSLFQQAMYYFFTQNSIVLYGIGITTAFVFLISLLSLLKKWGESY